MKIESKSLAASVKQCVAVGDIEPCSVALTFACDADRDTAVAALVSSAMMQRRVEEWAKKSLRRAPVSDRSARAMTATDAQRKAEALEALHVAIREAR